MRSLIYLARAQHTMDHQQRQLFKLIDNILRHDWDPIGLGEILPDDEYTEYVPVLFENIISNKSHDQVTETLEQLAIKKIGIVVDREHHVMVARKLIAAWKELLNKQNQLRERK